MCIVSYRPSFSSINSWPKHDVCGPWFKGKMLILNLQYWPSRSKPVLSCASPRFHPASCPTLPGMSGLLFGCPSPCDLWPSHLPISIAISGCGSIATMQPFFLPFWAHVHSISFWSHYWSYLCVFLPIIFLFVTWCGHHILTIFLRHIFIGRESIQSLLFCFK